MLPLNSTHIDRRFKYERRVINVGINIRCVYVCMLRGAAWTIMYVCTCVFMFGVKYVHEWGIMHSTNMWRIICLATNTEQ
jgi:uncharacterized membrane protein YecN with MAPEG domain